MMGFCSDHGLPGFSSTYAAAWAAYEETGYFIFLTVCFRNCRELGWEIPETVLSAMDRHFAAFHRSETNEQARKALSRNGPVVPRITSRSTPINC